MLPAALEVRPRLVISVEARGKENEGTQSCEVIQEVDRRGEACHLEQQCGEKLEVDGDLAPVVMLRVREDFPERFIPQIVDNLPNCDEHDGEAQTLQDQVCDAVEAH